MYPTAPPWKRGRPGTAPGWKRASSSPRARGGLPGGRGPREGGEGRVEVSGQLGVDRDQVPPLSQEPELLSRRREGRDVEAGGLHRGVRRPLQASASSFFWSWLFGTAPMTWSRTLPPLTKRIVGIERIP